MIVDNLAALQPPAGVASNYSTVSTGAVNKPTADYNTFLKLLIAQMKSQDPTQPSDPTKYISQLASFSAVEQATQTNKKLDSLFVSSLIGQASSYVGKHLSQNAGSKNSVEGTITAVQIFSDGLVATLDHDKSKTVIIGPGVTITDPASDKAAKHPAEETLDS